MQHIKFNRGCFCICVRTLDHCPCLCLRCSVEKYSLADHIALPKFTWNLTWRNIGQISPPKKWRQRHFFFWRTAEHFRSRTKKKKKKRKKKEQSWLSWSQEAYTKNSFIPHYFAKFSWTLDLQKGPSSFEHIPKQRSRKKKTNSAFLVLFWQQEAAQRHWVWLPPDQRLENMIPCGEWTFLLPNLIKGWRTWPSPPVENGDVNNTPSPQETWTHTHWPPCRANRRSATHLRDVARLRKRKINFCKQFWINFHYDVSRRHRNAHDVTCIHDVRWWEKRWKKDQRIESRSNFWHKSRSTTSKTDPDQDLDANLNLQDFGFPKKRHLWWTQSMKPFNASWTSTKWLLVSDMF